MNSEVEQRIVAMYFDNKDFEKNAKQTINTLGELKDNLNLEDSVKGFEELNKAGKKLNLSDARTAVRNLRDSLGGLGEKIKNALNIGNGPLHTMRGFFNEFNGYVTKVAGIDLAGKLVSSFENAFRQLTTAPIEAGWNMYQANVDSTKTIMSGTLQSYKKQMSEVNSDWTYNEAEHMEYVKGQLKELSEYAQKTVFSLSDMTSNVGKFTNQGIDLETSVTAMEGIANMTAKAGQGAQQASMAMYNISQALGVGKMTTIDWKSIENANIATTELKDLFIQTAAASGKLTKQISKGANGKEVEEFFITVDKEGKKLAKNKWVKVSAENFRDTLSNGWLDKETMLRVFQLYSNQVKDIDTLAAWGFDTKNEELVKYLFGIGEEAEKAATQVRTFSKMWDAMTEAVQSGWATSMEFIFGDMMEATEFWSTINEKLSEVLDSSAEKRNNMLREWRGYTYNENTGEWEKLEGAVDGREDLVQAIYTTIDAAKSLGSAFSSAWSDVFGNLTGKKLQEITKGFRDFMDRFKAWLGDMDDSNSRIRKIRTGLSGVFSVLKVVATVIKTGLGVALRIVKPFIDPMLKLFERLGKKLNLDGAKNLGEMLTTLRDRFSALWTKIQSMGLGGVFEKVGAWFSEIWEKVKIGVGNFLDENGLTGVKEWFIGIGDSIKEGYETVKTWWESSGIPEFFQGIWNSITGLFQPVEVQGKMGNTWTEDSPFVRFFKDTWGSIQAFFEEVIGWPIWGQIGSFFEGIWNNLVGVFQPVEIQGKMGNTWTEDSPFVRFFKDAWSGIQAFFEEVQGWPIWTQIGSFFEGIWNSVSGVFTVDAETGEAPIVTFFRETWGSIQAFFEEVIGWPIWGQIGSFFEGIWNNLIGMFQPVTVQGKMGASWEQDAPIVAFFKSTWEGIKGFFEEVIGWPIWAQIGSFFEGIWNNLIGVFQPVEVQGKMGNTWTEDSPFVRFFKDAWGSIQAFFEEVQGWEIWGQIGTFFEGIWNSVSGVFTANTETGEAPIVTFFRETWEKLRSIFEEVQGWDIWDQIGGFFSGVWTSFMSVFNGEGDTGKPGEAVKKVTDTTAKMAEAVSKNTPSNPKATEQSVSLLERVITAISGFIQSVFKSIEGVVIPPEVSKFFVNLGDVLLAVIGFMGEMLGHLKNMINGNGSFAEWAPVVIVGILTVLEQIFSYRNTSHLAKIGGTESFASKFMSVGLGLLAISAAIALLTTIDQGKMWSAVGVVAIIGTVVGGIIHQIAQNTEQKKDLAKIEGKTEIWTKLIGAIEKIAVIGVALALLPEIIRAFGEAKKMAPELEGTDIMNTLLGITAFIAGVSLALGAVQKMTDSSGISPTAAVKTGLAIAGFFGALTAGFGLIGTVIAGGASLGDTIQGAEQGSTIKSATKSLEQVSTLMLALGGFVRSFWAGLSGQKTDGEKLEDSQTILLGLAEQLENFTSDKTSGLIRVLNLIGLLQKIIQDVPDASKIEAFTKTIAPIADAIAKFNFKMNGWVENGETSENWNMDTLEANIEKTAHLFRAFNQIDGQFTWHSAQNFLEGIRWLKDEMTEEDFKAFGHVVSGIVKSFETATDTDGKAMASMADKLMENLSKAIKIGLDSTGVDTVGAFDATPIVDSIVKALGYGETAIAEAVHLMVQAGLNASQDPGSGNGGYKFDPTSPEMTGLFNFLNGADDPEKLMEEMGYDKVAQKVLFGENGTKDKPSGGIIGELDTIQEELDNFEFDMSGLNGKFDNLFAFKDPETGESVDIAGKLRQTITDVQTQIDQMPEFKITIVPTFDLKNLNAETLRQSLMNYPVGFPLAGMTAGTVKVDMSELGSVINTEGIRNAIASMHTTIVTSQAAIVASIDNMGWRISALSSAIGSLRLYLDTGVLVGGITPLIDMELGRRANTAGTTGVVSSFGNPYAYLKPSGKS